MSNITIVVPTCPRASHPNSRILDETIASVREQLPESHVIITCDGPRAELNGQQRRNYAGFCESIQGKYDNTRVVVFTERGHQTGNMEAILPSIDTPLIFYCEDDWRILPNVQWAELSDLILKGEYNYIKLYPQSRVSPYHQHLMVGYIGHEGYGSEPLFMIKTIQFSANPHLASTAWYRSLYENGTLANRIDFIEEALHGIISQSPWEQFRLGIYNPSYGDFYRCLHLDGKGTQ